MIVITGATGNIGRKITTSLLSQGRKVRVVGRDAGRLAGFAAQGAETAVGDLRDVPFLTQAFSGATAAFALIPPNVSAADFRAYQNEVGAGIAVAIQNSGVAHIVNLSSQGAHLTEGTGPVKGLHDQEERLNRLPDVNILHVRPTYFMENLLMNIPL
ncbi:MAG: NAD-dependent epimerase/dehydratase family protein, partial [Nitrospirae bacterium]